MTLDELYPSIVYFVPAIFDDISFIGEVFPSLIALPGKFISALWARLVIARVLSRRLNDRGKIDWWDKIRGPEETHG